jgi:hypothetical protein
MKNTITSVVLAAALCLPIGCAWGQEAGSLVGPDPISALVDARERSKLREAAPLAGGVREDAGVGGAIPGRSQVTPAVRSSTEARPLGASVGAEGDRDAAGVASSSGVGALLSMALPLGAVIVLLLGCMVLLKRVMGTSSSLAASLGPAGRAPGGVLEVLGRYPVAKGQLLVLIKIDRRVLLVGHSAPGRGMAGVGGGFSTLCEITDPEEVAAVIRKVEDGDGKSASARFGAMLQRKGAFESSDEIERRAAADLGMQDVAPSRGRRVDRSADGDVTEMWDENASGAADLLAEFDDAGASHGNGRVSARVDVRRGASSGGEPNGGSMSASPQDEQTLSFAQIRARLNGLHGRSVGGGTGGGFGGVA